MRKVLLSPKHIKGLSQLAKCRTFEANAFVECGLWESVGINLTSTIILALLEMNGGVLAMLQGCEGSRGGAII